MKQDTKSAAKPKIAAAAMTSGATGAIGAGITGSAIEKAMHDATMEALASGVTDPVEILRLKLAARERVKAEARVAAAAAD